MRKAILPAIALALVAALWWFLHDSESTGEPEGTEAARETARAAEQNFDRMKERLNAFSSAEVRPPKGDLEIRGRVLGAKGPVPNAVVTATQPVAGETLSALACHCGNNCGLPMLECGCPEAAAQLIALVVDRRGEAPPITRATTDGDGQYVLRGLEAGAYTLWADAPSGIGVRGGVKAGDHAADVELAASRVLHGVVRGEDKQPIAGAMVTAIHAKHSRFFDALTGADGKFQLGPVPQGRFQVVAAARELLPDNEAVGERDKELELTLYAPRRLAGQVLRNGAPISDARVSIDGEHHKSDLRSARDGAFAFERLRPGEYKLEAIAGREQASATVTIAAGADPDLVRLELLAGAELRGMAKAEDGTPVAGADVRIRVETQTGYIDRKAKTDSSGTLSVTGLPTGEGVVWLRAEDFVDPDEENVKLAAGDAAEVHWTLKRATLVTGVVLDADGNPFAGANVAAGPPANATEDERTEENRGYARTEANGTFRLKLPAPANYDVRAEGEGFLPAKKTLRAPLTGVELRLRAGHPLKGIVIDPWGAPAAGAKVWLTQPGSTGDVAPDDDRWVGTIETDDEGQFEFKALVEGKYSARAEHTSGHTRADVTIPSASPLELRLSEGGVIAGKVVDAAGQPVKDVMIHVVSVEIDPARITADGARSGRAESDAQGAFIVRGLQEGPYAISARKEGFIPPDEPGSAQTGERDVKLVLQPTGHIRGRVVDESGKAIAQFKIDGDEQQDPAGEFKLQIERTEERRLVFDAGPEYAQTTRTVKVVFGKDFALGDVVIGRGTSVRGRVIDQATRAPIAGALVDVGDPIDPDELDGARLTVQSGAATTRADGTFELPHVDLGRPLWIFAQHDEYPTHAQPLTAGDSPAIELRRGGTISGRVLSASGSPVETRVFASTAENRPRQVSTAADGRFRIDGLPAGDYRVAVYQDYERSPRFSPVTAHLELGGSAEMELRERAGGATLRILVAASETRPPFAVLAPGAATVPNNPKAVFSAINAAIQPRDDGDRVNTFEAIAPGAYTVLYGVMSDDGLRVAASPLEVSGDRELSLEVGKDATFFTKEAIREALK